jgi:hypothetical protein
VDCGLRGPEYSRTCTFCTKWPTLHTCGKDGTGRTELGWGRAGDGSLARGIGERGGYWPGMQTSVDVTFKRTMETLQTVHLLQQTIHHTDPGTHVQVLKHVLRVLLCNLYTHCTLLQKSQNSTLKPMADNKTKFVTSTMQAHKKLRYWRLQQFPSNFSGSNFTSFNDFVTNNCMTYVCRTLNECLGLQSSFK